MQNMKTYWKIAVVATAGIFVACSKEQIKEEVPYDENKVCLSIPAGNPADVSEADGTKTSFDDSYSVVWNDDDKIGFFIAENQTNVKADLRRTDGKAYFRASVAEWQKSDMLYAYYPYSVVNNGVSVSSVTLEIPAAQTQTSGFNGQYNPMVACPVSLPAGSGTIEEPLKWKHLGAVVELQVKGTGEKVKSVTFSAEGCAGSFNYDIAETYSIGGYAGTENAVTVTPSTPADLTAEGISIFITVIPGTYSGSLTVETDKALYYSTLTERTFERASVSRFSMNLEGRTNVPVNAEGVIAIGSAEVWNTFAAMVKAGYTFSGKTVKITENINADNLEIADGVFNGTLDGNSKTIARSAATRPLFGTLGSGAKVSNLTLSGAFSSLEKAYEWGNAALAKLNLGTVNNVSTSCSTVLTVNTAMLVGGLVAQNGGKLIGCSNTGNINITYNGSKAAVLGGGLAAYGHSLTGMDTKTGLYYAESGNCSAGVFENCNNSGTLSVTAKSGVAGVSSFGGICGIVEYDGVQFKGCSNSGAISRISNGEESTGSSTSVGGILGRCSGSFVNSEGWSNTDAQQPINVAKGYAVTIENCTNSAELLSKCRHNGCINSGGSGARFDNVGGIVGAVVSPDASKSVIRSCTNKGKVSGGWATTVNTTLLGGIAGLAQNVDIEDCKAEGALESISGTCVGAAGGFAGFVIKNVNVTGTSSCSASFTMSKLNKDLVMWWGLAFGYIKGGAASISGVTFSSSVNIDDVVLNGENYENYICNPGIEGQQPGSNVQPSVSGCTWSDPVQ